MGGVVNDCILTSRLQRIPSSPEVKRNRKAVSDEKLRNEFDGRFLRRSKETQRRRQCCRKREPSILEGCKRKRWKTIHPEDTQTPENVIPRSQYRKMSSFQQRRTEDGMKKENQCIVCNRLDSQNKRRTTRTIDSQQGF